MAENMKGVFQMNENSNLNNVIGIVTGCLNLNIYKDAFYGADIVAVVSALSELCVDLDNSTDDWYFVCTASGIEGFCMKKFVAIRH